MFFHVPPVEEPKITFPLENHIVVYRDEANVRCEIEMRETSGGYCNGTRKGRKTQLWEIKREFEKDFPSLTFVGAHMNIKDLKCLN
jgi:hypothetical protein